MLLRTGYADEAEKVLDPIIRVKGLAPEKKNELSHRGEALRMMRQIMEKKL